MAKMKSEGSHERNDTVFIEKMDGGLYIDDEAYLEGGYLHMPEAGWSCRPPGNRKIALWNFNVNGHRPSQASLIYYFDEEPIDPLLDDEFVNKVLPDTFLKGSEGKLRGDQKDRKFRQMANLSLSLMAFCVISGTVLTNSSACSPDIYLVPDQSQLQAAQEAQAAETPANQSGQPVPPTVPDPVTDPSSAPVYYPPGQEPPDTPPQPSEGGP